jgi:hypothetical protein
MCWSSDWEEQELLNDEARREDDERRLAEAARERDASQAEPEQQPELVRT